MVLHLAVESGALKAVELLLAELGADPNIKDDKGQTPLDKAISKKHVEIIKMLAVKSGVDVNAKNKDGQTLLQQETIREGLHFTKQWIVGMLKL
jgi:ankyrin repeat protein